MNKFHARARRASLQNAKRSLHGLRRFPVSPLKALGRFYDRRFFHFDRLTAPVAERRRHARVVARASPERARLLHPARAIVFQEPRKVFVCMRRRVRKEVLFALNRSGAGNGKPRRNALSHIGC